MNPITTIEPTEIVFFLDALSKYCTFYFGEEKGKVLYNFYWDSPVDVAAAIKDGRLVCGGELLELRMVFEKMNADIFFNNIQIYYVQWPYDRGEVKLVSFQLFQLTYFSFYETLGGLRRLVPECGGKLIEARFLPDNLLVVSA